MFSALFAFFFEFVGDWASHDISMKLLLCSSNKAFLWFFVCSVF